MSVAKTTALFRQAKVLTSWGVSSPEKLLTLTIADHENEQPTKFNTRQGACKAAIPQLVMETGLSYSFVAEALLRLTDKGLLIRYDRGVLPAWYTVNHRVLDYFEGKVEEARVAFKDKQKDIRAWRRDKNKFNLIEVELPADLLAEGKSPDVRAVVTVPGDDSVEVDIDSASKAPVISIAKTQAQAAKVAPRRFIKLSYALQNLPCVRDMLSEQDAESVAKNLVKRYDERLPMLASLRLDDDQLSYISKADNVAACLFTSLEKEINSLHNEEYSPEYLEDVVQGILCGRYKGVRYSEEASERFFFELMQRAQILWGEPEIRFDDGGFPIVIVPVLSAASTHLQAAA